MPECFEATGELLGEVLRLRSECYSADLGREIPARADAYDFQENCRSFLLRGAMGSIRPCVYHPELPGLKVPIFDLYGAEIGDALPGSPFVQSTHFVSRGDAGHALLMLLFREVFRAAVGSGSAHIVTVVQDKEIYHRFYGRLGFRAIASGRTHPQFGVPTTLLCCEFSEKWFRTISESRRLSSILEGVEIDELPVTSRRVNPGPIRAPSD
jgi:hypothetical protein